MTTKTVSLRLPISDYSKLLSEAVKLKISMSDLLVMKIFPSKNEEEKSEAQEKQKEVREDVVKERKEIDTTIYDEEDLIMRGMDAEDAIALKKMHREQEIDRTMNIKKRSPT